MIYQVSHTTTYDYDAPVVASFAELRQLPCNLDGQACLHRAITTDPVADHLREHRDYFGNLAAVVVVREEHTQLVVTSTSLVDTAGRPTAFGDDGRRPWRSYTVADAPPDDLTAVEFTLDSPLVTRSEQLAEYARPSFGHDVSLADGVMSLCARIHADFEFDVKATEIDTPIADVMALRKGVCQDFAHVMIGALRSLGVPAAYVSGYLETLPPPGRARLTGADRTHAWVGVVPRRWALDRDRSDEQPGRRAEVRHDGARSGLRRRAAAEGCDLHRRRDEPPHGLGGRRCAMTATTDTARHRRRHR